MVIRHDLCDSNLCRNRSNSRLCFLNGQIFGQIRKQFLAFLFGFLLCLIVLGRRPEVVKPILQVPTPMIIVITPTYQRITRLADLTRMANTLRQVANLYWIVVEDGPVKIQAVEEILNRSRLPYAYWADRLTFVRRRSGKARIPRDQALSYIRENIDQIVKNKNDAVVYFGDDDNTYDLRLFDDYIRKVKRIGVWAVGLAGMSLIESPRVKNRSVIGWDVAWGKGRAFAIDMAGFALHSSVVLNSTTTFSGNCVKTKTTQESCFLKGLGITRGDLEPFGFDKTKREVLVWHTKTINFNPKSNETFGYIVENNL